MGSESQLPLRQRRLRRPGNVPPPRARCSTNATARWAPPATGLLPGHAAPAVRRHRRPAGCGRAERQPGSGTGRGWSSRSRSGGTRPAPGACTPTSAPSFERAADLPDRSLPGQGHRSEPAGPALRQLDLRADLEPELGRQRADHGGRDARGGLARRLLRCHRRGPRHRAEPCPAGTVAVPDGAADVLPSRGHPGREGQAAPRDQAADRAGRHRRRAVRGQYTRAAPGTT